LVGDYKIILGEGYGNIIASLDIRVGQLLGHNEVSIYGEHPTKSKVMGTLTLSMNANSKLRFPNNDTIPV
jgi:hypothetical protein